LIRIDAGSIRRESLSPRLFRFRLHADACIPCHVAAGRAGDYGQATLSCNKRVLLCDEDVRPFVSGAYQARYCSDRCRNRALKRAYRERHRDDDLQRTSA
jgi:hypothetical protein